MTLCIRPGMAAHEQSFAATQHIRRNEQLACRHERAQGEAVAGVEILAAVAAQAASVAARDAWRRLQATKQAQAATPAPEADITKAGPERAGEESGQTVPLPLPVEVPTARQDPLSDVLETYYNKVGRRADVSFFAAIIAAILGYVIIAAGIAVGIYRSDDMALAVVMTAAGAFSQVLSFFFFRNRAEERRMMLRVLADLRDDAEKSVRAARSLALIEQVQQPLLRDNLTAAVALELSGASADLKDIHDSMNLFSDGSAPDSPR
ncbi:TRADD-N-associated membrane domain-containing protein [Streptomyces nigrescens]